MLLKTGLKKEIEKLAIKGGDLFYISTHVERVKQMKLQFNVVVPPFHKPFSKTMSTADVREAWGSLWSEIGPRGGKYGGPMPEG